MTVLSAIGIQTWRAKRPLPGAKPEVFANVMQFNQADKPILNVIYPRIFDKKIESLLDGFWRAIENAGHCKGESQSLGSLALSDSTPNLILGTELMQSIKIDSIIPSEIIESAAILDDPEKVFHNPKLKANWWKTVLIKLGG